MKLLRYGPKGAEKPGLLDANGQVRDLSAHVADIGGAALSPESLKRLAALDPASLPLVPGTPQKDLRLGPCVGGTGSEIATEIFEQVSRLVRNMVFSRMSRSMTMPIPVSASERGEGGACTPVGTALAAPESAPSPVFFS